MLRRNQLNQKRISCFCKIYHKFLIRFEKQCSKNYESLLPHIHQTSAQLSTVIPISTIYSETLKAPRTAILWSDIELNQQIPWLPSEVQESRGMLKSFP